ncbi:MAG: hypothetical protein NVSMB64_28250 [Candidatus Velthaea sp.]
MRDAVAAHDQLLARVFAEHDGYVFKTVGDAFCVAFARVGAAIDAALAVQRSLASGDWTAVDGLRVRMAIHAGTTDERDGDYFGPVVNRVARLLSTAHGGQIVLSEAAATLARPSLPDDVTLRDLGVHRLKDLSQPERIAQLDAPDLPAEFPPLVSLDSARTNLPVLNGPLIGRDAELRTIAALMHESRLVSLCGPGGIGKTRLAAQIGAEISGRFADGVWFVDLAAITDPTLVPSTLAALFGVSDIGASHIMERIAAVLAPKATLLIFDNCEQVVQAVAALADALLRACPNVRIIATTREALRIPGEHVYRVPSHAVPPDDEDLTATEALKYGAVELFVHRISSLAPFTLTDENAPVVADICRRLDGIALAIELAAARVKILTPRQVAQRLDERFRMLSGGSRTALPRQQTLRALIDWSHDLLDERERVFFLRAGVFAGSFDLVAAVAVCAKDAIDEWDVLDTLEALVDKSIVTVEIEGEARRYRLLETMRAYARERLSESGETDAVYRRFSDFFRLLAERASTRFWHEIVDSAIAQLDVEHDNFRAVLEWSISAKNDPEGGAELAGSLGEHWSATGYQAEGFFWLESALAAIDPESFTCSAAQAWFAIAYLTDNLLLGRRGLDAAQRAVRLGGACGQESIVARGSLYAGLAANRLGQYDDADVWFEQAAQRLRALGEERGVLLCTQSRAGNEMERGNVELARALYEEVLAIQRRYDRKVGIAICVANMALLESACGDQQRALELATDAVALGRELQDKSLLANLLVNLAAFSIAQGQLERAKTVAHEAITLGRKRRYAIPLCIAIEHLALIAALEGESVAPARLLGFTSKAMEGAGFTREVAELPGYRRLTALLAERLTDDQRARLMAEGEALTEQQAIEEVLDLDRTAQRRAG